MGDKLKIYLMTPYSHLDDFIRKWRAEMACLAAGILMKRGHTVFSPIAHSHGVSLFMDNSLDREFWLKQDQSFMDWADIGLAVDFIDDPVPCAWYDSYGINWETERMLANGQPVLCAELSEKLGLIFGGGI